MLGRIITLCILASIATTLRLYLIGGASNETSSLVWGQLAKLVPSRSPQPGKCDENWNFTTCPRIAVVTSAAENSSQGQSAYSEDADTLSYRSMFLKFGMAPQHLTLHRDNYKIHGNLSTPQGKANLYLLQQADIIFFNGGDQSRHSRTWLSDDGSRSSILQVLVARATKEQVILSGTSAGSMIWSQVTVGGGDSFGILYFANSAGLAPKKVTDADMGGSGLDDIRNGTQGLQYNHNGGKMPSFGLVNFTVDTHFNARGRLGRIPSLMVNTSSRLSLGIDEVTAFSLQNDTVTIYGYNAVTICDLRKALIPPTSYFSASGIRIHYLTAGDSYNLATGLVTSNKSKITAPYYSSHTDSNDILAGYEASLLTTRLVDQKELYNLGKTRIPSAFPSSTPSFEMKFYKDGQTMGYYSDKKYTATNVLLDFSFGAKVKHHLSTQ